MKFSMLPQVFAQMFKKPFTNKFPAKYIPSSTTKFLEDVDSGKAEIIPPIETPEGFRGKIVYDRDKCIGKWSDKDINGNALLSGNTVVYKPSKLVPAIGQFIAKLFHEIDLPRGVFNMVQGDAAIGSQLAGLPQVDGVLFTGSYPAGKRILQATADQFHKLVALQLGRVG